MNIIYLIFETYIDFLSSDISPTTYKDYFLVVNYVGSSVGQLYVDFSTNNCSSFTSNTYEYNSSRGTSNSTSTTGDQESGQTYITKMTYDTTGEVARFLEISNLYVTETTMVNCVSTANNAVMFIEIQYMVEKLIVAVVNNTIVLDLV